MESFPPYVGAFHNAMVMKARMGMQKLSFALLYSPRSVEIKCKYASYIACHAPYTKRIARTMKLIELRKKERKRKRLEGRYLPP
jgi:hypothetical protein